MLPDIVTISFSYCRQRLQVTKSLIKRQGIDLSADIYHRLILHGNFSEGSALLDCMRADGIQPDARIYNTLLIKCDEVSILPSHSLRLTQ